MDRPTVLEEGHHVDPLRAPLVPHRSRLPNYLYIFSFAPPVPPISRPKEFFDHPIVLYVIGTIAAAASGVGLPAFDIVTGIWTDGITADNASYSDITGAGSQAGWIMTVVGVAFFATFGIFLYCCKSRRSYRRNQWLTGSHCCCYKNVEYASRAVPVFHCGSGSGLL
jgi:hypothetical protein